MNGAESFVHTLAKCGVDTCFANPGTSEMHFVSALDRIPGVRSVLCLFEGVVTGAADGYGRMAGKPAATLLHLGPGLAYGGPNLHNARRAHSPIVNVVGDHATYHRALNAPLTSDVGAVAGAFSDWCSTSESSGAADAVRHLLNHGHRHFGVLDFPLADNDRAAMRRDGVVQALAERGIALRPECHIERPYGFEEGGRACGSCSTRRRKQQLFSAVTTCSLSVPCSNARRAVLPCQNACRSSVSTISTWRRRLPPA